MTTSEIIKHTIDDAGCMVWQRGCCNGHPAMRIGKKTMLVRRVLWSEQHGAIPDGHIARMTCETVGCVNPEHISLTTYKKLGKQLGKLGVMSGPVRSANIAKAKRKTQAKLTIDDVRTIRASTETGIALADRFGVAQAHISKIRLHKAFKEFSTPWSGL